MHHGGLLRRPESAKIHYAPTGCQRLQCAVFVSWTALRTEGPHEEVAATMAGALDKVHRRTAHGAHGVGAQRVVDATQKGLGNDATDWEARRKRRAHQIR